MCHGLLEVTNMVDPQVPQVQGMFLYIITFDPVRTIPFVLISSLCSCFMGHPKKWLRGRLSFHIWEFNSNNIAREMNTKSVLPYICVSFFLLDPLTVHVSHCCPYNSEMWKLGGIALKPKAGSKCTLQENKGLLFFYNSCWNIIFECKLQCVSIGL